MPSKHPDADELSLRCGGCQWFASGHAGAECRKTREVALATEACVEYQELLPSIYSAMAGDKYIMQLAAAFSHPKLRIDMSLVDELKSYLIDENLNFPHGSAADLEAISLSAKRMTIYKSRVASIYAAILEAKHDYEELCREAAAWLYAHYPAIRGLKNDAQRQAAFDKLFPDSIKVHESIRKLTAVADKVEDKLVYGEKCLKIISSTSERVYSSKEGLRNVRQYT
jgi:hypothetical protein